MTFATLPPEINSTLMYSGPGSGPMLAAAEAWGSTAAELYAAANSYESVVSALASGPWLGSSSSAMAAAASSYIVWLSGTAALAEDTATQATAAAVAYEVAFAATVPPEVVAANRSLLAMLVATNLLGQNTPAIAATEAQYAEMWAQDVAAMFDYAGSAASATRVTPFSEPQQTVSPAAAAAQGAAVSQAAGTAAGDAQGTVSQLAQAFSAVPNALSGLVESNVVGSLSPGELFDYGADIIAYLIDAPMAPLSAIGLPIDALGAQTGLHTDEIVSGWVDAGILPGPATALEAGSVRVPSSLVTAGLSEANAVGGLSVPPTWTAATPAVRPVALSLPAAGMGAPALAAAGSSSALSDVAVTSVAGRALADTLGTRTGRQPGKSAQAARVTAAAPDPDDAVESTQNEPRTAVTGIAAEIRDLAKLRDEGLITDDQFVRQRNRLLDL